MQILPMYPYDIFFVLVASGKIDRNLHFSLQILSVYATNDSTDFLGFSVRWLDEWKYFKDGNFFRLRKLTLSYKIKFTLQYRGFFPRYTTLNYWKNIGNSSACYTLSRIVDLKKLYDYYCIMLSGVKCNNYNIYMQKFSQKFEKFNYSKH